MAAEVELHVVEKPLRWVVPRSHHRARLRVALPLFVTPLLGAFFADSFYLLATLFVVGGGGFALTLYALLARARTYEVGETGWSVRFGDGPPRFHPWSEFQGYSTHAEASRRGVSDPVQALSDELGETFVLHPRSAWRLTRSLATVPGTTAAVRARLARVLPHRPGIHLKAAVWLIALGLIVGAAALTLLFAFVLG